MGRYTPARKIQAKWWDPDEAAWIRTKLSFNAAQRVAYHGSLFDPKTPESEEALGLQIGNMVAVLVEIIDHWTLRQPGVDYEPGLDRPIWEISPATLAEQPMEDILYLFTEGMRMYREDQPASPADLITPAAAGEGLQPG